MASRNTTYGLTAAAILASFGIGAVLMPETSGNATATVNEMPVAEMEPVTSAMSGAMDRDTLRAEIRAYLLEEPELLVEVMQVLEQKRTIQEAQDDIDLVKSNADRLFEDGFSFVGGNPEGSITLVEFQDYRCGYCKRAHDEVQALVKEDGDIRLIIKEFPILGADSMKTSQLAIATLITQGPDAYKRFSDALMTFAGPINDKAIERLAKGALVDIEQTRAALNDAEVKKRIDATHALGQDMRISGTPTFVIGSKIIRGYIPQEEMAKVVELSRRVDQ